MAIVNFDARTNHLYNHSFSPAVINDHQITRIFTNLFLKRKALPKEYLSFSFSTGFLFVKKKKCRVNLMKSRGFLGDCTNTTLIKKVS